MLNEHLVNRLAGIQNILKGIHEASSPLSSASKGYEREQFIDRFLAQVLPPIYRFGSGDVIDHDGKRSSQLDVVVESPFGPSLPIIGGERVRLYLAEVVAAVIEVKSDVSNQWKEVLDTAENLAQIKRELHATVGTVIPDIPFIAVGYTGWKKVETVRERIKDGPIDGLLVIDAGFFVGSRHFAGCLDFNKSENRGPLALWTFITCLNHAVQSVKLGSFSLNDYVL